MVCSVLMGYVSEYIQGCDIAQFGEGCEKCVKVFESSWSNTIIILLVIVILCFILAWIVSRFIEKQEIKEVKINNGNI